MHTRIIHCMGALALAAAMPFSQADEMRSKAEPDRQAEEVNLCDLRPLTRQPVTGEVDKFGALAALANDKLDAFRGGADTTVNDLKLNGTVAGNTAINVVTGSNFITDGSFANASGVPIVIQNSGANVLIQNATVVNLEMR